MVDDQHNPKVSTSTIKSVELELSMFIYNYALREKPADRGGGDSSSKTTTGSNRSSIQLKDRHQQCFGIVR